MRTSVVISDILYILSDGKVHTYQEIAAKLEVSKSTVRRHVASLMLSHPIDSFCGGDELHRGGIKLDISNDTTLGAFSEFEKEIVLKALCAYKDKIQPQEKISYQRIVSKFTNGRKQDS